MTESSEQEFYTIPSSSSWFKWDEIHAEEERALPDFFDRSAFSRNPRVYREYRDFIINKFREDPSRRLTFTEVRKSLVGDIGSLWKVFLALERWGLINFGVSGGESLEIAGGDEGPVVVVDDGAPAGVKVVPASGEMGSASLAATATVAGGSGESSFRVPPLTSYTDVFGDWVPKKGPMCGSCSIVCDLGQSESTKDGYAICTKCLEKNSSTEEKSADDVKVHNHVGGSGNHPLSAWTDAETLLLLEAVIKHGDDWDRIAQHVRTKSKLECIAKLIHLPFAENMVGPTPDKLDNIQSISEGTQFKVAENLVKEVPQESINADREKHIGTDDEEELGGLSSPTRCLKRRRFPSFTDPTDSLMKQVALLSTVAGPHVAAVATESAVTALCHENPCARKAFEMDEVASKPGSSEMKAEPTSEVKIEDQDMKSQRKRGKQEISPEKNVGVTTFRIRAAVATSIGVAAARATLLANQEEREIELLMTSIIEMQLKKIQSKMRHFEELEHIMECKYAQIQELKESILEEWTCIIQQAFHAGIPRWRDNGFPKFQLDANASSSIAQLH